jgi:hypothetical protein
MAQSKVNRAQMRAMEVRAAETLNPAAPGAVTAADALDREPTGYAAAPSRRTVASSRRPIARPIALTKEQEYRFIRADMRRLGVSAAALFVFMIALLIVVD